MILTADFISAEEAKSIGIVEKVVNKGTALEGAKEMCGKISERSPLAVSLGKKAMNQGFNLTIDEGMKLEAEFFGKLCDSADKKEGVQAFLEKRSPVFKGM